MKYLLILMISGNNIQIWEKGPFSNIFACEQAMMQIKLAFHPVVVKGACINVNATPIHWNGKPLKEKK